MWSLITALTYRWLQLYKVHVILKKNVLMFCVIVTCKVCLQSYVTLLMERTIQNFMVVSVSDKTSQPRTLLLEMSEGIIPERSLFSCSSWTSIGSTQIGILTLKQDFGISTILPFGMGGERSRKIRTVGINNPLQNCVCKSQWFAVQHWRME